MIKVNIVCIGKIKESFFREAYAEYAKRLSRFCSLELIELDEFRGDNVEKVKEEECKKLQKALRGRKFSSFSSGWGSRMQWSVKAMML